MLTNEEAYTYGRRDAVGAKHIGPLPTQDDWSDEAFLRAYSEGHAFGLAWLEQSEQEEYDEDEADSVAERAEFNANQDDQS